MKSEMVGCSSVVSEDLVQSVDQKLVKDGTSQFQNVHVDFQQISLTLLYEIITVRLGYHKYAQDGFRK
jgi:hypothetical protein